MGLHRRCPYVRFLGSYPRADAVEPTVHVGTADTDFVDAAGGCRRSGAAPRPDGPGDRDPHDERRGSTRADSSVTRPTMSPSTCDVLAALHHDAHLLRPGVVDAADLGGQVVAHARALQHHLAEQLRPAGDAAAGVDRGDVEPAVVEHARRAAA